MTLQYLRLGKEAPVIRSFLSENHPYSVTLVRGKRPTLQKAEILLNSAQNESLEQRVKLNSEKVAVVDEFFQVQHKKSDFQTRAVEKWSALLVSCKKIQYGAGSVGIGLTFLALLNPPFYIVIASYVGAVASACLFGWSLHRYHLAETQLAVWQKPGEDFAQKRKAALELPLPQIIEEKCHFYNGQGTLLGVEILSIFRTDFKQFATPLLAREYDKPEAQHRWVLEFLHNNPFVVRFFEKSPELAGIPRWKDVQKFQAQIDLIVKIKEHLEKGYAAETAFKKREEGAKQPYDSIWKNFNEKVKEQKMPFLQKQNYYNRVSKILKEECLDPIHELYKQDHSRTSYYSSLIYPQVRAFLEEANKGLLLDQPYKLDAGVFADPAKFVPAEMQLEVDTLVAKFPQNVIEKAREIAPEKEYQDFITAAFKA
ncbi:MAG TPA: hypothetical protein VFU89_01080 [Rhabdochlamydiaceae bacterium]|nr:hypothetical protein [Rhabdochlamydiaceae bacterium]